MNATGPQEKGELELLVDRVLGKERKWRRLTAVMYVLPFFLVVAGAAYSGYLISEAESKRADIQADIKTKTDEITRLNAEIAKKTEELKAIGSLTQQLPQRDQESINAIKQASESPSKDLQAFVIIASLPTLDRARNFARRFSAETRQKAEIYKTSKGVYAVTLGAATTPDEANNRLNQAKTTLNRKDAYIRYSVDWIRQPG